MISVAGVRGIVGDSLDPSIVVRFSAALARSLPGVGPVVIGRDARVSGPMVRLAACAGLNAAGRDVVDIGLATTPTTQLAVEHLGAAGGVILTASHNPAPWNALKFLSARGEFLSPREGNAVRERFEQNRDLWVSWDKLGGVREEKNALEWHLERVLSLRHLDVPAIRARKLHVVVDGCASVGGAALPALLERLGATVTKLDCEPNGKFTRELEPLPEHLGALGEMVRKSKADLGIASDPDSDRAAFVDAAGVPLGEEYTVALGTRTAFPSRGERNSPRALRNLSAFHGAGLWLAVKMTPPAAFRCSTASCVVGVVARPMSTTSRPAAFTPAQAARRTMGPLTRASRPITTGPSPGRLLASAAEKRATIEGSSESPTMPRTPATEIMRVLGTMRDDTRGSGPGEASRTQRARAQAPVEAPTLGRWRICTDEAVMPSQVSVGLPSATPRSNATSSYSRRATASPSARMPRWSARMSAAASPARAATDSHASVLRARSRRYAQ